jgi:hypothetical protein
MVARAVVYDHASDAKRLRTHSATVATHSSSDAAVARLRRRVRMETLY